MPRATFVVLATCGLLSLGCSLFGGGKFKSESCQRYLDCAAAVDPASVAALQATYGENGTCGDGTAEDEDRCEAVCVSAREDLLEANPFESACTADGAEVDASTDALFGDTTWDAEISFVDGLCYWTGSSADLTITGDDDEDFTLVFSSSRDLTADGEDLVLDCVLETDLVTFTCDPAESSTANVQLSWTLTNASFSDDYTYLEGEFLFEYEDDEQACYGEHTLTADR